MRRTKNQHQLHEPRKLLLFENFLTDNIRLLANLSTVFIHKLPLSIGKVTSLVISFHSTFQLKGQIQKSFNELFIFPAGQIKSDVYSSYSSTILTVFSRSMNSRLIVDFFSFGFCYSVIFALLFHF